MKALLVTSRVTFVPRNYDDLVCGLADCEHIGGLLVLDNTRAKLARRALGLVALGARGVGGALLRNMAGRTMSRRRAAFAAAGKPVWLLRAINDGAAARLVRQHDFDLVVNARTRAIFAAEILAAPRLGCINVHHGLLPEQRGTMCDLWALRDRRPAGFSVHKMTAEIDAGQILARVQVSDGSDRDYPEYLAASARREVHAVQQVLAAISTTERVAGEPNDAPPDMAHYKTPSWREVGAFRQSGLRI